MTLSARREASIYLTVEQYISAMNNWVPEQGMFDPEFKLLGRVLGALSFMDEETLERVAVGTLDILDRSTKTPDLTVHVLDVVAAIACQMDPITAECLLEVLPVELRTYVATFTECSGLLSVLAYDQSEEVRVAVAENEATPPRIRTLVVCCTNGQLAS